MKRLAEMTLEAILGEETGESPAEYRTPNGRLPGLPE
jgi:hypothetical protein